ncbi:hypothetical protein [Herbaspirillum huttiense]|uniref:hypothetical protein n=1 Tax=Herbaspirillum huttiense TaxID=863372 RepID=UPI0031DAA9EB
MTRNSLPRGRGRPATHSVDRIRTRLWFAAVKEVSGLPSAYAIEMLLDGEHVRKRSTDVARPRKWDGYKKGKKVPSDIAGPRNSIDQAEHRFPGTAAWYRSPIWDILKGEFLDANEIENALRGLGTAVTSLIFEAEDSNQRSMLTQRPFDAATADLLIQLGSFDALVAAVLLVALSEVIASAELRRLALHVYVGLQATIRNTPLFKDIYPDLLTHIDLRCKHWTYLSPNQRMETVIFWRGVAGDFEREVPEYENPLPHQVNR